MNKRFLISWLAIFVVWMLGSFVVHGMLLGSDYANATAGLMRTDVEQQSLFHWMLIAHVIMAGAFVWIYNRGAEDKPWMQQGMRYGLAVALLAAAPTYMIYYTVQPIAGMLVVKQIVFDSALLLILGMVVAFLNKPAVPQ